MNKRLKIQWTEKEKKAYSVAETLKPAYSWIVMMICFWQEFHLFEKCQSLKVTQRTAPARSSIDQVKALTEATKCAHKDMKPAQCSLKVREEVTYNFRGEEVTCLLLFNWTIERTDQVSNMTKGHTLAELSMSKRMFDFGQSIGCTGALDLPLKISPKAPLPSFFTILKRPSRIS